MRLKNVLITVKDMEKSKAFYKELFGLDVILDNDGNVILTEGLGLQDAGIWEETVGGGIIPRNNASELYFEETDVVSFAGTLVAYPEEIQYITRLTQDSQGRKVIRFYDPDGNLIEVGQNRKIGSFQ